MASNASALANTPCNIQTAYNAIANKLVLNSKNINFKIKQINLNRSAKPITDRRNKLQAEIKKTTTFIKKHLIILNFKYKSKEIFLIEKELQKLAEYVADIVWNRATKKLTRKIDQFIQEVKEKQHPEKQIAREQFAELPENQFFNFHTKQQIKGIKTIKALKIHCQDFPQDEKSRYYATKAQFFKEKRLVLKNANGVAMTVMGQGSYISTTIYNYHQTEEIPTQNYVAPLTREQARKETGKKKKRMMFFIKNDFTCNICKKVFPYERLEIDHIKPISLGGVDDPRNWQCLCITCNRKKGNKY